MLREFPQPDEEAVPLDKKKNVRVKRAAHMLRDFPKDPKGEQKVSEAIRKERRAAMLRHGFVQSNGWIRSHKRLVALGLGMVLLVLVITVRHGRQVSRDDDDDMNENARLFPKQHCSFRKYRRAPCPTRVEGPGINVPGAYQSCVLDLIFDTIGTTNKHLVEVVAFAENSTLSSTSNTANHHRMRRRLNLMTTADNHHRQLNTTTTDAATTAAQQQEHKETPKENHLLHLIDKGFSATSFHLYSAASANPKKDHFMVREQDIAAKFHKAHIPRDVDFVSIKVHNNDLWVLHGLLSAGTYRPRVIAVEFNANFPLDMMVSVDRRGVPLPHPHDSVLYGASAAALNHVAELFGYQVVEIMTSKLDMFFIRQDVLQQTCSNYDFIDSFQTLGLVGKLLGYPHHSQCDVSIAQEYLVDVPTYLTGQLDQAKAMAHVNIKELNMRRQEARMGLYCNHFTDLP